MLNGWAAGQIYRYRAACIKNNNSLAKHTTSVVVVVAQTGELTSHSYRNCMLSFVSLAQKQRKEENDWVVTALFRSFEPDASHMRVARGFHEYTFPARDIFVRMCM